MFEYLTTSNKVRFAISNFFVFLICISMGNIASGLLLFLLFFIVTFIKLYFISKTNKEKATFIFKAKKDFEKENNN